MNVINAKNYEEMSLKGCDILLDTVRNNPNASICLASGGSPKRMYELFAEAVNKENIDISNVTFVKLDDWYDVNINHACTSYTFIQENLLSKLNCQPKQFISLQTEGDDFQKDCDRVQAYLDENPLDVMILGLGMNGHLGLNEPNEALTLDTHIAMLHEKTKTHDMAEGTPLTRGITIGLKGIFKAKSVLMLVCGSRKEEAFENFMSRKITTSTPASLLWLHHNCNTIIDREKFPQ